MNEPLVSVITPTYNHAHFLSRTIESLRSQTYEKWEMVIVDDGSTDNTEDIVRPYVDRDNRIMYLPQPHRGVGAIAATLNIGLGKSSGPLVTMLGSDDMWPPHRLEKQVPVFADPAVVLCFGRGLIMGPDDEVIGPYPLPRFVTEVMNRPVGSILGSLLISNWLPQYTVLIRRSALEQIGGYLQPEGLLAEDYPTHLALALTGEFRFVDLSLGNYRMHPHQQTRMHRLEMQKRDAVMVLDFYRSLDPDIRARTGLSGTKLRRALDRSVKNAYFQEGRRWLLRGDRKGSRRLFMKALIRGSVYTKAKALAGLVCSVLRIDFEQIAQLARRPRLR